MSPLSLEFKSRLKRIENTCSQLRNDHNFTAFLLQRNTGKLADVGTSDWCLVTQEKVIAYCSSTTSLTELFDRGLEYQDALLIRFDCWDFRRLHRSEDGTSLAADTQKPESFDLQLHEHR